MNLIHRPLIAITACLAAATPVPGQSRQVPAPPQDRPVVIHSATVHPVSGPVIESGYIVFSEGRITDVGEGTPPTTQDAESIDASGLHVYPGLIASDTYLGLTETGAVDVTHDHTEHGRMTPEVRAAVAVNPDSDLIPVTRANGILVAMTFPRGGTLSGRGSLIRLDGWTWEEMAIEPEAGVVINWPRVTPISRRWMNRDPSEQREQAEERIEELDRFFDDAGAYYAAREHDPSLETDLRFEAMRASVEGRSPVYIRASSGGQIESAVAWAHGRNLKPIIVGGAEADRVIPLLSKHDVAVIVEGTHRMPSQRHDAYEQPFALPAKLHEAGVRFCIASGAEAAHERNLNHNVATAAAYGLPADAALRSVTLSAAEILGVGDRLGSLDAGKSATLIVTTGDPLEITTDTLIAYIDGRRIDLGNRQKSLYVKYRQKYEQLGLLKEPEAISGRE